MSILALDYRPHRFAEVVGQNHIKPILRALVRQQEVPPALLFAGSQGTGKTTCARVFAAALNCEAPEDGDACSVCPSCKAVQGGVSLSVLEIDAASNGQVAEVRKLKDVVSYSHDGEWRVVMLDEAQQMSREAFNALLKMLEEPPERTVFILLTTEPQRILDTVASRSMQFEFRRLQIVEIVGRLRKIAEERSIQVADELLTEIAVRSQGGLRDAVMALDQVSRVEVRTLVELRELLGVYDVSVPVFRAALEQDFPNGLALIEEQFYRHGDVVAMIADLAGLVRDLLVLKTGGEVTLPEFDAKVRHGLSEQVTVSSLVRATKVLWDLRSRVKFTDIDIRAQMEMGFVLLADSLAPVGVPIQEAQPAARRMTLADMAEDVRKAK